MLPDDTARCLGYADGNTCMLPTEVLPENWWFSEPFDNENPEQGLVGKITISSSRGLMLPIFGRFDFSAHRA